jgi:hypothetical protein
MERSNNFLALIVINFGVVNKCMKHGKIMLRTKPVHNINLRHLSIHHVFRSWFHVRESVADRDALKEKVSCLHFPRHINSWWLFICRLSASVAFRREPWLL